MEQLSRQKCEACRRGAPQLTDEELAALYAQIPAWSVVERDGIKRLERMVKTVRDLCRHELGVDRKHVHTERYD